MLRAMEERILIPVSLSFGLGRCPVPSPDREAVCVVALRWRGGVIALGAHVMAMPIVQRPSCLTSSGAGMPLLMLALMP